MFERISKNDVRKALECLSLGKRAAFEHRHPIYTTPFSWQGHWSLCGQLLACLHAIESFYYLNRAPVTDNWITCKQTNHLNTSRRKYSERSVTIRSTATVILFRESDENIFEIMRLIFRRLSSFIIQSCSSLRRSPLISVSNVLRSQFLPDRVYILESRCNKSLWIDYFVIGTILFLFW